MPDVPPVPAVPVPSRELDVAAIVTPQPEPSATPDEASQTPRPIARIAKLVGPARYARGVEGKWVHEGRIYP